MPRQCAIPGSPTFVLIHGAGHTSHAWEAVQTELRHPSLAVDLPGRHDRPADVASVTIDAAARSVAADVKAARSDRVVLVGHSAGGIVVPAVAALLGARVEHLVFVAGLCAPDGQTTAETIRPGRGHEIAGRLEELREQHRGHMVAPDASVTTMETLDPKAAMGVDSVNLVSQPVSWYGVAESLPRTFVRCLRDAVQPRDMQARFAASCRATTVVDIDTGHNPALEAPAQLAEILDRIVDGT